MTALPRRRKVLEGYGLWTNRTCNAKVERRRRGLEDMVALVKRKKGSLGATIKKTNTKKYGEIMKLCQRSPETLRGERQTSGGGRQKNRYGPEQNATAAEQLRGVSPLHDEREGRRAAGHRKKNWTKWAKYSTLQTDRSTADRTHRPLASMQHSTTCGKPLQVRQTNHVPLGSRRPQEGRIPSTDGTAP